MLCTEGIGADYAACMAGNHTAKNLGGADAGGAGRASSINSTGGSNLIHGAGVTASSGVDTCMVVVCAITTCSTSVSVLGVVVYWSAPS